MRVRPKKGKSDWEIFIIEVNPNPYLEQTAEVAMAAARKQLEYGDLVEKILELAMHRNRLLEPPEPLPAIENGARA
jgi:D-alanine-D-alanine ligase-like ATP-grasp enzyme